MAERSIDQIHVPVLRDRCVELVAPALTREGAVYVDCTLGMAGHALAVLDAAPTARLIGIDRDPDALAIAGERLRAAGYGDRIHLAHATYDQLDRVLEEAGCDAADAILMDLGLSSYQIDVRERGFSYSADAPLDMRMDPTADTPTAADLVATLDARELARILSTYGEERFAPRIARAVVAARALEPVRTTGRLAEIIAAAVPAGRHGGGHPAKRSFQALRIAVNEELDILEAALETALDSLGIDGRLVVESYHSLEDRLVKKAFAARSHSSAPLGLPVELEEHKPTHRLLTRGAEKATASEIEINPRSASVRLRAIERTRTSSPFRKDTSTWP